MPKTAIVECTDLEYSEAKDLKEFLVSQSEVESVNVDNAHELPPSAPGTITIHASASPIQFIVEFAHGHLASYAGDAAHEVAKEAGKAAFRGICRLVTKWLKKRKKDKDLECKTEGGKAKIVRRKKKKKR